MHDLPIKNLRKSLDKKEFSALELTKYFLDRIKKLDPNLNSLISLTDEKAIDDAKVADTIISKNQQNMLTGIPIIHKDIFCSKDVKTSCGSKMLDNFIAPYNATVVQKCQDAGTVLLGKANMDEFAMGSSNENSYYGSVKNPWDLNATPGGSSGGSACAVAARMVPFATGTDTGGSVRQPAAFCGITGIKPTYGRVSRFGMVAYASSLDQAGVLAKSAEDCAYLLQTIAGHDHKDSTSVNKKMDDYFINLSKPLKGKKIGVPKEYFNDQLDSEIAQILDKAIAEFKSLGAEVISISLSNSEYALPAYYIIAPAEASSNLERYDGIRYGHRCKNPSDLNDLYSRTRSEGFGHEVKLRIMMGTFALSSGYYDAYYSKAQKLRQLIANDFKEAFNDVDAIFAPTTPYTAFKLGEKTNDPISMYLSDIYTIPANLAGLPAISIPAGFSNNMPVGLQLIGPHFSEGLLLNMANQYQQHTNWHTQTAKICEV